ncbi:MAG: ATP-binding protein [Candidatus Moraniibacteriota bacterium]
MKIYLPNSAFIGNINPFIKRIDFSNPDVLELTAHEKWVAVHPVVLSLTAALSLPIKPENVRCEKLTAISAHYLERMGLFEFIGIDSGMHIERHESAGRFIPLTRIDNQDQLSRFVTDMVPLLHLDPNRAASIKYVVSELVRNVLEHADSPVGAIVSAQYYKKTNMIRLGIVDTGIGIRRSIEHSHRTVSDLDAIRLALTPGITGTTAREGGTEQNAGAGLFFIKSIASMNDNFFMLYSGNALYKLLTRNTGLLHADPFDDPYSSDEGCPFFRGTAVGVDISLDGNEEFSKFLSLVRDIYTTTVKERRKARYKQRGPKFI